MSADFVQTLTAPTSVSQGERYQIDVSNLCQGMYVVELDRPWLDTPFLLRGFMIDSQVELDTLERYCTYAYVDLTLSNPELADSIRQAAMNLGPSSQPGPLTQLLRQGPGSEIQTTIIGDNPDTLTAPDTLTGPDTVGTCGPLSDRAAPPGPRSPSTSQTSKRRPDGSARQGRSYKSRSDVRISDETRRRFRQMVRDNAIAAEQPDGVVHRVMHWVSDHFGVGTVQPPPKGPQVRLMPDGARAAQYPTLVKLEDALPRARLAYETATHALQGLMTSLKSSQPPQLAEVLSAMKQLVSSTVDNPDALMWVARHQTTELHTHQNGVKVALYMLALGRHLGFPQRELTSVGLVGLLADVGKSRLPRALLDKPGMLSPSEFSMIKEHVKFSVKVLSDGTELPSAVIRGIAEHHERIDGSGYPQGLRGEAISIYGRIAAIADTFSALITPRQYASALSIQEALMSLYEWSGSSFSQPLVEQFVQAIGVFPVGSLVELATGEVAVVTVHNRTRRLEPRVLVLSRPDKFPLPRPIERDLLRKANAEGVKPPRIARALPPGAHGFHVRDYYLEGQGSSNGPDT